MHTVANACSVGAHGGGATSVTLARAKKAESDLISYRRVQILLTPSSATRHNSPQRPDVAAALCREHLSGEGNSRVNDRENVDVIVVLPKAATGAGTHAERSAVLTMASAIARSLPEYTRRGGLTATPDDLAVRVVFQHADGSTVTGERVLALAGHAAVGVREAAALVDMPCNELHAATFARRAHVLAEPLPNVMVEEIVGEELRERGFGGIYGVGKASVNPPRLVILEYRPPGASRTVAWCGKGIVYDTGGLSIKGKTTMPGAGGAGVVEQWINSIVGGWWIEDLEGWIEVD